MAYHVCVSILVAYLFDLNKFKLNTLEFNHIKFGFE